MGPGRSRYCPKYGYALVMWLGTDWGELAVETPPAAPGHSVLDAARAG